MSDVEFAVRIAPDTILNRNETLGPGFMHFTPKENSPCWRMRFDTRRLQIATDGPIVQSTCAVSVREDWPAIYIGGEPSKLACQDSDSAVKWAEAINDTIASAIAEYKLVEMSDYVLENWLNNVFAQFSFWSSRLHPEDAIDQSGGIRNKKPLAKRKRGKRVSKHQIANEVANASKDLDHVIAYVEKVSQHELVGKPAQELVAPLARTFEHSETKQEDSANFKPVYKADKLREIEDEKERKTKPLSTGKKRAVLPVQDRSQTSKVKLVAILPLPEAYELCKWCLATHHITLCTLDQGMDSSKVVKQAVYRPLELELKIVKSIATKAASLQRKSEQVSSGKPADEKTEKPAISDRSVANQIVFDLADDSKGRKRVGFVYDTPGKGSLQINFIVIANGANYLYKDAAHLGGPWSNAAKAIGNKSLHATFRTKLQAAVNRLQKRKSEVSVVYNPTDTELSNVAATAKPAAKPAAKIDATDLVVLGVLIEETDQISIATPERVEDGLLDDGWGEWVFDCEAMPNLELAERLNRILN